MEQMFRGERSEENINDNKKNDCVEEEKNYLIQSSDYQNDSIFDAHRARMLRRRQHLPVEINDPRSSALTLSTLTLSPTTDKSDDEKQRKRQQKRWPPLLLGRQMTNKIFPCDNSHNTHHQYQTKQRKKIAMIFLSTSIFLWMTYQSLYVFSTISLKRWKNMKHNQNLQQKELKKTATTHEHHFYQNYFGQQGAEKENIPIEFYDYVHNTSSLPPKYIADRYHWSSFLNKVENAVASNLTFLNYASPDILDQGCDVTIVLMDPNVPLREVGHKIWFMLESVAEHVEYTEDREEDSKEDGSRKNTRRNKECMVIQTASCKVTNRQTTHDTYQSDVRTIGNILYDRSLPLFQRMIERGQVRISILNHTKYNFKSCSNFFNPSSALMNINYWKDEFISEFDSDLILTVQDDCVFCRMLDPRRWKDVAYVGSPWSYANGFWHYIWHMWNPKRIFKWTHVFLMCDNMEKWWNDWVMSENHEDSIQHVRGQGRKRQMDIQIDSSAKQRLSKQFPPACNVGGYGVVGNGGLTLRSQKWLIKAIELCPHAKWSGMDTATNTNMSMSCHATNDINEDAYFATVLNGIGATMPKAYDASLFSVEMIWPEEVASIYGPWTKNERMDRIQQRWSFKNKQSLKYDDSDSGSTFKFGGSDYTVPIAMHKPWWYQPTEMLQSEGIAKKCKFLKYMFQPEESRCARIGSGPIASWWQFKRYFRFLPFMA